MDLQALADITDVETLRAIIAAQALQLDESQVELRAEIVKRESIFCGRS